MSFFSVELEPSSWAALQADFESVAKTYPDTWNKVTPQWAEEVLTALKTEPYPPQPFGSRYQRTHNFRNSWELDSSGSRYTIQNMVRGATHNKYYARHVVGDPVGEGQSWVNPHWWLARDIIQPFMDELVERHADETTSKWGSGGGGVRSLFSRFGGALRGLFGGGE